MDLQVEEVRGVRLAIEGCGHGTLHAIYASIDEACKQKGWSDGGVDLVIIGGDFQAVRNAYDLHCVSMPPKYRSMCDFHEYYSGHRKAPYLTIFVGGNHEASNYLFELYYGGWVAPNIYYMGAANVLRFGPLRIAGMSGIWKGFDYNKHHFERLPYNESEIKSIYHVRELDIRKLLQIQTQVDIGISHDWPQGVEWKGNWKTLFRQKRGFEEDARSGRLGSVAAKKVLQHLRPKHWFSAHLHCKFAAVVAHGGVPTGQSQQPQQSFTADAAQHLQNTDVIDLDDFQDDDVKPTSKPNEDEIDLDMDMDEEEDHTPTKPETSTTSAPPPASDLSRARSQLPASFSLPPSHPPEITNPTTSFLALDKCLPSRHFLQLLSLPSSSSPPFRLKYDREWLSITRAFALLEPPNFNVQDPNSRPPRPQHATTYQTLISESRSWLDSKFPPSPSSSSPDEDESLIVPESFSPIAPIYDGGDWRHEKYKPENGGLREWPNNQTEEFCQMLGVENPLGLEEGEAERRMEAGPREDAQGERLRQGRFDGGRGRGGGRGGRGNGGGRGRGRGRGDRRRGRE